MRKLAFASAIALLLAVSGAQASKEPLTPEQLLAQSKLIVTGQVQSHREDDRHTESGSIVRDVYLNVKVDKVDKGDAKPGDVIQVRCWVVVREPRDGVVWDAGHGGIPADGGRARFFLDGTFQGSWSVIYPNGLERLDSVPPLHYERAPAERLHVAPAPADPPWIFFILVGGVLVGIAGAVLIIVRRTKSPG